MRRIEALNQIESNRIAPASSANQQAVNNKTLATRGFVFSLSADPPVRVFFVDARRSRYPSRFIRGIVSCRSRSSIDGHSDWPAKRSARKSTNERTFADTWRRLAYTA